jgi:hypothetical protein
VLSDHFEGFVADHAERYQAVWGVRRRVVDRTVAEYLGCGLPERGFARIRCSTCAGELILPFSCKTRGLCPSCGAKRTAAWAAWIVDELARSVPHRHVVVTLPKMLRPFFKFDRALLTDLGRWVTECLRELMVPLAPESVRPGCVAVLELAGNLLNVQPHVHAIVTSGAFDASGRRFHSLPDGFHRPLEELIRARVLRELHERGLLSEERLRLLRSWHRSGFSVHVGEPIAAGDRQALERLARYVRRLHLADSRIVYDEAHDRVIYGSGKAPHPKLKANFRVFEARDFTAHVVAFIPDPWRHQSVAYGEYANAVRGRRRQTEAPQAPEVIEPPSRRVRRAWRDLIRRIYEVDPLLCACGGRMWIVAFVTERAVIVRILRHLGLWPPPLRPPKPGRARPPVTAPTPRQPARALRPRPEDEPSQVPPWWDEDGALSQVDSRAEE